MVEAKLRTEIALRKEKNETRFGKKCRIGKYSTYKTREQMGDVRSR